MAFPKGKKNPGAGRPKGVPNKLTTEVKAVIVEVAMGLGGAQGMLDWVKKDDKNEAAFWTSIYPRIAPLDVAHTGEVNTVHKYAVPDTRPIRGPIEEANEKAMNA